MSQTTNDMQCDSDNNFQYFSTKELLGPTACPLLQSSFCHSSVSCFVLQENVSFLSSDNSQAVYNIQNLYF